MLPDKSKDTEAVAPAVRRWRLMAIPGTLLLLLISFVLGFPYLFERAGLQDKALAALGSIAGTALVSEGASHIRTFPGAQFSLFNVRTGDETGPLQIKAAKVTADFSLMALLRGRMRLNSVVFADADIIRDERKAKGASVPSGQSQIPPLLASAINLEQYAPDLQLIACIRCSLSIIRADGTIFQVSDAQLRWNWPGGSNPAVLTGDVIWRGQKVDFNASASDPSKILNDEGSTISLEAETGRSTFSFHGQSNLSSDLFANGDVAFSTPSLESFLEWAKPGKTAGSMIGPMEFTAKINSNDDKFQFSDMALSVGGVPATGTFDLELNGSIPKAGGSLAFEAMDLPMFLAALPIGAQVGSDISLLDSIALDLRLSAKSAKLGSYTLDNAAGAIRIQDGTASIDLGTADIAGGNLQGRLLIDGPAGTRRGTLSVNAREIKLATFADPAGGLPAIDAPLALKAEITGDYTGLHSYLAKAQGTVHLDVGKGFLRNFSTESFSDNIRKNTSFELSESYAGFSELENATVDARLRNGLLLIDRSSIILNGHQFELGGVMPLTDHGLAFKGRITDAGTTKASGFFLGGTWERPVVTTIGATP